MRQKKTYSIACSICKTLVDAGFIAYIAGGWVRDLLLKIPTDEIDIATNASPKQITALFPKTIQVGAHFGVIVVLLEGISFEVATFRQDLPYVDGRHPIGVDFSTPEKDATRRDFTINGMFYDPLTETLYDYVEGQADLQHKRIRAIGDPYKRFHEDRLRMIRAVRFSARLDFKIEEVTLAAIKSQASTLFPSVSIERVWQELQKMSESPRFDKALEQLHQLSLLEIIFPSLKNLSSEELRKRIHYFSKLPQNTPSILYIFELCKPTSLQECVSLCEYLKTSSKDSSILTFFYSSEELFRKEASLWHWAHFYAHPLASLFLEFYAIKHASESMQSHIQRQEALRAHIERIRTKRPLITAALLQQHGILPGKEMGSLLRQAEEIAINQNLNDPEAILSLLLG